MNYLFPAPEGPIKAQRFPESKLKLREGDRDRGSVTAVLREGDSGPQRRRP